MANNVNTKHKILFSWLKYVNVLPRISIILSSKCFVLKYIIPIAYEIDGIIENDAYGILYMELGIVNI